MDDQKLAEILDWHFWSLDRSKDENRKHLNEAKAAINQLYKDSLREKYDKGRLQALIWYRDTLEHNAQKDTAKLAQLQIDKIREDQLEGEKSADTA